MRNVAVVLLVLSVASAKPAPDGHTASTPSSSVLAPRLSGANQLREGGDIFMELLALVGDLIRVAGDITTRREFQDSLNNVVEGASNVLSVAPKIVETKAKLISAIIETIVGVQEVFERNDVGPKAKDLLDLGLMHTQSTFRQGSGLLLKLLNPESGAADEKLHFVVAEKKIGQEKNAFTNVVETQEQEVASLIAKLLRSQVPAQAQNSITLGAEDGAEDSAQDDAQDDAQGNGQDNGQDNAQDDTTDEVNNEESEENDGKSPK